MKKCILIMLVMIFSAFYSLKAQELQEVIPPSPNVAALEKYVETPVSLSSGIPTISIPVYEIKDGDITLPISLSYHAGGIRVEDIASWVGLGWNLNAGGAVMRTVVGLPDDSPNGYMHTDSTVQSLRNLPYNSNAAYNCIQSMILGDLDYEPDVFSYNFSGYSGRFFYNQVTHEFVQTPYSNIKITPHYGNNGETITAWVFTTPDGVKYYFGKSSDYQRTGVDETGSPMTFSQISGNMAIDHQVNMPSYIDSWYLMDIVSPTGHHVKFTYTQQIGVTQLSKISESYIASGCDRSKYSASFSQSTDNQAVIQDIEFTNGKVEFVPDGTIRKDLTNTYALKAIEVYSGNKLLKKVNLYHDYFVSAVETGKWVSVGDANQRRYRLRLTSVDEENSTGQKLPEYSFEYDTIALPSRFSNAQDYWGYYNGATGNPDLIPETEISTSPAIYVGDADRTVSQTDSKAGMLEKINYPTGGSITYEYESNMVAFSNISSASSFNLNNRATQKSFSFSKYNSTYQNGTYISDTLVIGQNAMGQETVTTSVTGCSNPSIYTDISCDFLLTIKGITNPTFSSLIASPNENLSLAPGKYIITALTAGTGQTADPQFSVYMTWGENSFPDYLIVGGQRIKKITLDDGNGNIVTKTFDYNQFGTNLPSGYAVTTPIFLDNQYFDGNCQPPQDVDYITSYSQAPLAMVNGNVLSYNNVTEYVGDKLKTEYTFSVYGNFQHYDYLTYGTMHLPDLYIDWIRGILQKKDEFRYVNNTYDLIRSTEYKNERVSTLGFPNVGVKVMTTISGATFPTFKWGFYSAVSEWFRPYKTIVTDYNGSNETIKTKHYIYDNNPLLVSKEVSSTSTGDSLEVYLYYPLDKSQLLGLTSSESTAVDSLVSENRLVTVLEKKSFRSHNGNSSLLSTVRTNYSDWGANPSGSHNILPSSVEASKGSNSLEDRIEYENYDAYGNPLEVSKKGDTHIVYLWGYNHQLPIAKIVGATYSEVISAIGASPYNLTVPELETYSDNDVDASSEATLRTELNKIRQALPSAMVTTYTYDPLIGVTSITDAKGKTTYYTYDEFERLYQVLDNNKKVLKQYEYHYQNQ